MVDTSSIVMGKTRHFCKVSGTLTEESKIPLFRMTLPCNAIDLSLGVQRTPSVSRVLPITICTGTMGWMHWEVDLTRSDQGFPTEILTP